MTVSCKVTLVINMTPKSCFGIAYWLVNSLQQVHAQTSEVFGENPHEADGAKQWQDLGGLKLNGCGPDWSSQSEPHAPKEQSEKASPKKLEQYTWMGKKKTLPFI